MYWTLIKCLKMSTPASNNALRSKFRGCMLGSLLGDCLGAPFEGDRSIDIDKGHLQEYLDKLESPHARLPPQGYTDDTAMTKSVAQCLIDKPDIDYIHLAKLFVEEYFEEPDRDYGGAVVHLFRKLKETKFKDVFKPATEQFEGAGSFGNGGAMRIAPVALYYHNSYDNMIKVATQSTLITHSNCLGVCGAVLQCIAIHQALTQSETIDPVTFCNELMQKLKDLKSEPHCLAMYQEKLQTVINLLSTKWDNEDQLNEKVEDELGNNISAHGSVPTAIFCFLRALHDIPQIKTDSIFRRTVQYAISLGGDTDTIANMAGAIAGAYLGEEHLNKTVVNRCEDHNEIVEMADQLYELAEPQ